MRPAFGVLRHVERRESNKQLTGREGNYVTETSTIYAVMITRIIVLWLTVWTYETQFDLT